MWELKAVRKRRRGRRWKRREREEEEREKKVEVEVEEEEGEGRGGKGFFFMRTFFCEDICWGDVKNWKIVSLLKGLWIIINCPFKHTSRT